MKKIIQIWFSEDVEQDFASRTEIKFFKFHLISLVYGGF